MYYELSFFSTVLEIAVEVTIEVDVKTEKSGYYAGRSEVSYEIEAVYDNEGTELSLSIAQQMVFDKEVMTEFEDKKNDILITYDEYLKELL